MLQKYEVKPTKIKYAGQPLQGYRRADLWDAWQRYLPLAPGEAEPTEPSEPPQQSCGFSANFEVPEKTPVPEPLTRSGTRNPLQDKGSSAGSGSSGLVGARDTNPTNVLEGRL